MTYESPDSLFKLRLTGPLRRRLEEEAAKRGITLTAEILRRIDETFSDTTERLHSIEKIVFDGDQGNEALWKHYEILHEEISRIKKYFHRIEEIVGIQRYNEN
ncbi:hypothetical protein [Acetobacter vaccinii]|uniref:Uncharacterized protein n=1 Tax=Acetobacter vaccinii TaxID=2592655 RepID=A0A5C1YST7_9PROT|nr:hypothetical protein [Acetobacter vaccinii]QEO17862.1 hypothetical protein FLP30_09055 [Acetobacter vaccinii]